MPSILAAEVIQSLLRGDPQALLDVRSEGEFAEGHIHGFQNFPILKNEERHQVGLTYKNEGQPAAIE